MAKCKDLSGKKFGRLTVLYRIYNHNRTKTYWLCICDCGNLREVRSDALIGGVTKSCGCLQKEKVKQNMTKHGKHKTRLYRIFNHMKARCYNEHYKRYYDYGGRGITVCDEWRNDFMTFYNWAMNSGYNEHLTIDRINNDGNYEPSNCRWSDRKTQQRNKRTSKFITYNGERKHLMEWCEKLNLDYNVIYNRLYNCHWSIDRAFNEEVK